MKKRVVVTGLGLVSPLGCGNIEIWNKIIDSRCGIRSLDLGLPITIAAQVPADEFDEVNLFGKQSLKQRSKSTHYALHASDLALKDAEFYSNKSASSSLDLNRCGITMASGMGTLRDITDASQDSISKDSYHKLSPYFVSKILLNMAAGEVSLRHKLRGPNHCVTTACAAGAHSIGDAYNFIRLGYADLMVAGGTEAPLDPLSISGFAKMRALSRKTDPLAASRPFDKERDGFVIGEGAAVLVLESLESAQKRGVRIYGEVVGYGLSGLSPPTLDCLPLLLSLITSLCLCHCLLGDAHHITSPPDSGDGAMRSMISALHDANISPSLIGYINAHATSTPLGDRAEVNAIHSVFSNDIWPAEPSELSPVNLNKQIPMNESSPTLQPLYVSSTKGATGHMLGAAGAMEAALTLFSLQTQIIPPTLNLSLPASSATAPEDLLVRSSFRHVPKQALRLPSDHRYRYAMSNSFGFGGTNATLIFKKYP
jgi:3-oxoacyl-[acyl-carrier-protein] synthase II